MKFKDMLKTQLIQLLEKLKDTIQQIPDEVNTTNQEILFHGTIGEHCRHIYEFCEQLISFGVDEYLSYDDRKRNPKLENSRIDIISNLKDLILKLESQELPEHFSLSHKIDENTKINIATSSEREYLFLLDHTIHHLAIIRIGIVNLLPNFYFPSEFGFTTSTMIYKNSRT